MAILFQHRQHGFRVLGTHDQQAIDALLRHHRQVGTLFFYAVPRVAQNQGIAFLEAVLLYRFYDLGKIGRFTAGRQQSNGFGVNNLEAARNRTWRIVQLFDRSPDGVARLFRHKAGFVNYM